MPRFHFRSRSWHFISDLPMYEEEGPSGRDSPIAHRTRSRATLLGRAADHQLPGRPTRRGRQNADSSRRERSRSPVDRRVVPESPPASEHNQGPSVIDQQGEEQPSCSICLVEYERGEEIGQISCWHAFHLECIRTWLDQNHTCPLCRAFVLQRLEGNLDEDVRRIADSVEQLFSVEMVDETIHLEHLVDDEGLPCFSVMRSYPFQ